MKKMLSLVALLFATAAQAATISVWTPGGDLSTSSTATTQTIANGAIDLSGAKVTGALPVSKGGSGAVSLTGVLKGSGTSPFSSALSADIIGLWSGTCNSSTYLRGDGSCQTPGGGGGSPGGSDNELQYNNAGSFGGTTDLVFESGALAFLNDDDVPIISLLGDDAAPSISVYGASSSAILLQSDAAGSARYMLSDGTTSWQVCQDIAGDGSFSISLNVIDPTTCTGGALRINTSGSVSLDSMFATGDLEVEGSVFTNGFAASTATVGGQSVCLEDGTDCPGGTGYSPFTIDVGSAPNGCNALIFGDSVTSNVLSVVTSDECAPPGDLGYDVVQIGGSTKLQIGVSSSNATIVNGFNEKIFYSGNITGYGSSGSSCGTISPSFLTCERISAGAYEVTFPDAVVAEPICTANPSAIPSTIGLGYDGILIDIIADTPVDDYVVTFRAYASPGEGLEAIDLNIKFTCIGFYN